MPGKKAKIAIVAIIVFVFLVWIAYPMLMAITESNLPHQMHAQLTGVDAVNDTTTFNVHGTDLGIIMKHDERYYYIF